MQPKEFNILLDIKKQYKGDRFEVVQGDTNSNVLNITLVDGINPYNLTGTNVEIVFSKADGTTVQQTDNAIIDAVQGKIRCILKTNTIATPGKVLAEVRVLEGDNLLTSARFEFYVRKSLMTDDTIESTNEFPILTQLIAATNDLIKQVEQIEKQVPEYIVEAMGDLEDLETEDKSSLVNAINEVNNKSVDLTPIEERIGDLEQDLDSHKAEIATQEELGHVKLPENWIEATLQNDWTQPGTSTSRLSYYKDEFGTVTIAGQCTVGVDASGTVVTSLPSGYRPRASLPILIHNVSSGNTIGVLQITSNGELLVTSSSNISTGNVVRILGSFRADKRGEGDESRNF